MFDDETLPDWLKTMKRTTNQVQGGYPVSSEAGAPHLLPPPGLPGLPGQHPELMPSIPHIDGLPPQFAPPGLPGLLPPPGAPLLGSPAPPQNILLRPGFPPAGAPLVAAPPPGFPGFDSSQPPPIRLPRSCWSTWVPSNDASK